MKTIIEQIIKEVFEKNEILEIKKPNKCFNNEVYIIKLKDRDVVLKFFNKDKKEKHIKKEKQIINFFKEKNPNLIFPEILYYDLSKKISPKGFMIMSKIEGKTFEDKFEEISNKEKIFDSLGKIIGRINSHKFEYYGFLDENLLLKEEHNYLNWKEKQIKKIKDFIIKIEDKEYFTEDFKEKNHFLLNNSKEILDLELGPCMCHGDLSLSNIIIDEKEEIISVIDFEFVHSGAPIYDLFKSIQNFKKIYPYRESLINGLSKEKSIPINWEELMWIYHWVERLKWLSELDDMSWQELSKEETSNRKKLILEGSLKKIDEIYSYFKNI